MQTPDYLMLARCLLHAAIIVISLFAGLGGIIAHDHRREAWRSRVKHRVYIGPRAFRRLTFGCGLLLLGVFLAASYRQALPLLGG